MRTAVNITLGDRLHHTTPSAILASEFAETNDSHLALVLLYAAGCSLSVCGPAGALRQAAEALILAAETAEAAMADAVQEVSA